MTKPKLIYFDAPASRGEECRIALHVAGVAFEDVRVKREDWPAVKQTTPFGSVPVLEMPGHPPLAQSNAILVLIGRRYGLHPGDDFEAARHEAMMGYVEDLRGAIAPTMRMTDEAEKKKAREALVAAYLPEWGQRAEKQIGDGPFFGGAKLHVVDLKLFIATRWLIGGKLDHIPQTIFAPFPKLTRVHDAVRDDARIKAWHAKA
ncbi:MAG: glutathione S-transferase family protein [Polyangiaceae bacterium]|jgi:prostaglandin-H2 D-isomerase / glutathione transferase